MTSQPGKQTIAIHILPSISKSKINQIMKFGQLIHGTIIRIIVRIIVPWLIEYNIRKNFLEKSYTKCSGQTIPTLFSKNSKLSLSVDQWSYTVCFYCMPG